MKSGVEKGLHIGMYEYAIVIQLFQLIGTVKHEMRHYVFSKNEKSCAV
jgi:hypothetical protein